VFGQLGAFFDTVGGILSLDPNVILAVQTAPNGLTIAIVILLVATVSDVVGNSPVLFFNRMSPGRLATAMGVETVLSLVRLAIWVCSTAILLLVVKNGSVTLSNVVLVIGVGYAPMVWSFLVVIPTAGPFIRRLLIVWTLVTITASIAVASSASPWQAVPAPVVATLVIVVLYRSSNRLSVRMLGRLSRQFVGIDLMQRTQAMDPLVVIAASEQNRGAGALNA
jgi:hypothetical protein